MDDTGPGTRRIVLKQISKALLMFIVFAMALPLAIGALSGIDSTQILTMITSTFVLQAAAPPIGLAMGLSPGAILFIMACFAIGVVSWPFLRSATAWRHHRPA